MTTKQQELLNVIELKLNDNSNKCIFMAYMKDGTISIRSDKELNQEQMIDFLKLYPQDECEEIVFLR
jgi:hypothetical protein